MVWQPFPHSIQESLPGHPFSEPTIRKKILKTYINHGFCIPNQTLIKSITFSPSMLNEMVYMDKLKLFYKYAMKIFLGDQRILELAGDSVDLDTAVQDKE